MTTNVMGAASRLYDFIRRSPSLRKFSSGILEENVAGEEGKLRLVERDNSYFQIRLSEMFLKDGRELWREFMPMTVFIAEFIFDGKQETIPFIVNNETLSTIQKYVDGQSIEYRNTRIAGPIPYVGGDLSLFTGLYRTKTNDFSLAVFGFMGAIAQAFDVSGLSRYLDMSRPLSAGLANLLGMKDVEFRLGSRDVLTESKTLKEGFWAFINVSESSVRREELWVKDGQLYFGKPSQIERYKENDYCLVKLEVLQERGDYTTLPFHRLWERAKDQVWNNQPEKAKLAFAQLAQELAVSPDLTKKHRFALMQLYKGNFESEVEAFHSIFDSTTEPSLGDHRGDSNSYRAEDALLLQYARLERRSPSKDVLDGVYAIASNWPKIRDVSSRKAGFVLTDSIINAQLKELQTVSALTDPDPISLAHEITLASLATNA
jgi:hypothetical protein